MTKQHVPQCASSQHRHYRRYSAFALFFFLSVAMPVGAEPLQRPRIERGGNNRVLPVGGGSRALVTQDLTSGLTPADLVAALLGGGVAASNIQFNGVPVAAGTFSGGTGIVGFPSGIMLSSGSIAFVPGPNTQDSVSGVNTGTGDADLNGLIPLYTTFDACVLEFDFTCTGTQIIQFQYVFTSEEYNEWVNTSFNDVFGFFLNGANIALIPGSAGTAVSINNLNCDNPFNPPAGSFCNLFVNNRCADIPPGNFPCAGTRDTEMDGLTVVLTATGTLIPGSNHIKLAIADAGDQVLDSNVFIQGQSFVCGAPRGACCDTSGATPTCTNSVLQADCQGPGQVWSVGLTCDQLNPPCPTVAPPSGTNCANPIPITSLPFVDVNTTIDKNNDYTDTCLGNYDNGRDILYELTITATQCVDITVTGATPQDNWIGVALDDVCPPSLVCIAQGTSQSNVATITGLTLAPGTYYLMIDRWPQANDGLDFTLSITDCGGASTGACCDPVALVCTSNVLLANCQSPNVWSVGQACDQLNPPCAPSDDIDGKDCEFPFLVTSIPFEDINTTADKQEDYSITCLGTYDTGNDIIYQITNTVTRCVDITVSGATPDDHSIGVVLDNVCPPGTSCLAFATTTGTVATISNQTLAPGTYYLMIDRLPQGAAESLDFRLSIADCPAASGACCFQDGHCEQRVEAMCLKSGGLIWSVEVPCDPSPCPYVKGDADCNHAVEPADIDQFIAALIGSYTGCDVTLADVNDSGIVDGDDVQPFVDLLLTP
jgi:hypothetical protein